MLLERLKPSVLLVPSVFLLLCQRKPGVPWRILPSNFLAGRVRTDIVDTARHLDIAASSALV